jgi:hypothetical protein
LHKVLPAPSGAGFVLGGFCSGSLQVICFR